VHGGPEQIHLEAWRTGVPFFKLLKHQEKFAWTPEADQALAQLSHPILQGKPNASHVCVRIIYTHMIDKTRVIPLL
jgi:hypothetical protein